MKNSVKIGIIVVLILAVAGIYYGKNIYGKKGAESGSAITNKIDEIIKIQDGKVNKPVVMELSTTTCPNCKEMYPIMESVNKKYGDKAVVGVIYLDDKRTQEKAMDFAKKYSVRVVPTIVFLDEYGQQVIRHEGTMSEEQIINILNQIGVK